MKAHPVVRVPCVLALLAITACQSPLSSRIEEKAAVFVSLPAPTQTAIREGLIDYGFTPDMVYIALGRPNRVQSGEATEGKMETWTYRNMVLSDTVAMKLGMNNPGARFQGGRLVSPNAPGGPSISSTKSVGPQPTVSDLADSRVGTLFVEFLNDQVFSLRLER